MRRNWREFVKSVLVWTTPAAATATVWSPVAAAVPGDGAAGQLVTEPGPYRAPLTFERPNYIDGPNLYAGHRSHSSHRSHYSGSGGSYAYPAPAPGVATSPAIAPAPAAPSAAPSGSTTTTAAPTTSNPASASTTKEQDAPKPAVPAQQIPGAPMQLVGPNGMPAAPVRRAPTPTMPSALPRRREKPEIVVMRVQLELKARSLYAGPIDGRITQELRDALRAFQILQRLPETGTMDNLTLAKLGLIY